MSELYTYQVARIRCHELKLLTKQDIDALMACNNVDACLRVLFDKGFGTGSETTAESLIQVETEKLWALIGELLKDLSVFGVLLYPTDYNNLKAAIKSYAKTGEAQDVFKAGGMVEPSVFVKAVAEHDFSKLPKEMQKPAKQAYQTLLQTHDGQLCDVILDKACLENILTAGKQSDDEMVQKYAQLTVAIANIKIALRCQKTGKSAQFVKDALVDCDTLNVHSLAQACSKGQEDILDVLSMSSYRGAVDAIQAGNSAFEKWCDDAVMQLVKKQKVNPFTLGPLIAFVIARQTELSTIKLILSGKHNQIPNEMIQERLRELYV